MNDFTCERMSDASDVYFYHQNKFMQNILIVVENMYLHDFFKGFRYRRGK